VHDKFNTTLIDAQLDGVHKPADTDPERTSTL